VFLWWKFIILILWLEPDRLIIFISFFNQIEQFVIWMINRILLKINNNWYLSCSFYWIILEEKKFREWFLPEPETGSIFWSPPRPNPGKDFPASTWNLIFFPRPVPTKAFLSRRRRRKRRLPFQWNTSSIDQDTESNLLNEKNKNILRFIDSIVFLM